MKQVLSLLLYYFSWHRSILWMVMAGFALLLFGSLLTIVSIEFNFRIARAGYLCALVLPFIIVAGIFRSLIANQRTSLMPKFHLSAGIALLMMALLVSAGMQVFGFLLTRDALPAWMPLIAFVMASGYMGYMQLAITSRYSTHMVVIGSWGIVLAIFFLKSASASALMTAGFLLPLLLVTLVGWACALYLLATRDRFIRARMPWKDKEPFRQSWQIHDKHPKESTPAGTLLLGMPDGFRTYMFGMAMWMVVLPFICATIFAAFNWFGADHGMPFFAWAFLATSAFLGSFSGITAGELTARTRLLWLRHGSTRDMQWHHLERLLMQGQLCTWVWAVIITCTLFFLVRFEQPVLFNYLIFIPCFSLFFMYFSMYSRIGRIAEPLKPLVYLGTLALIIWSMITAFETNNYTLLYCLDGLYLILAGILRQVSRSKFLGIDWHQIHPVNLARIYGQM